MSDAVYLAAVRAETFKVHSDSVTAALDTTEIDDLIEKSSLGTEGARLLRARTSPERAAAIVEGAAAAEWPEPVEHEGQWPGGSLSRGTRIFPGRVDEDIASIVTDASEGDPAAMQDLLHQIGPIVVRYCRIRLMEHEQTFLAADDVAQEICLAVLTALPTYRSEGGSFLRFLYAISAAKVADAQWAIAQNRADPVAEVPERAADVDGPETRALHAERAGKLAKMVSVLSPVQQEVIALRIAVGLSATETAEALQMSPGAVRIAQHRALARLRRIADDEL